MNILFSDLPKYDEHTEVIVSWLANAFGVKKGNRNLDVWNRNCRWVQEIYDGTFTHRQFDDHLEGQLDTFHAPAKVLSCRGDWDKVMGIVQESWQHLQQAKSVNYMPYNKKFVYWVKFSNFFDCWNHGSAGGLMRSPFLMFVLPPPHGKEVRYRSHVEKLIEQLPATCKDNATAFCKKYFSNIEQQLKFYHAVNDFCRWLSLMRKHYFKFYKEMIAVSDDGNLFNSYSSSVVNATKKMHGPSGTIHAEFFHLRNAGMTGVSCWFFRNWLEEMASRKAFENAPVDFSTLYTEEDFVRSTEKKEKKENKETIKFDDFVF